MKNDLDKKIEAILFFKGEPVSKKKLTEFLDAKKGEIEEALKILDEKLADRGLALVRTDDEVALGTSPDTSGLIEKISKEELERDIGRAGLETLSIVIYRGPISRAKIDHIRGVNSSFILRNLMIRGLVERETDPNDARSFLYKPTLQLLSHLGVTSIDKLPEYSKIADIVSNIPDEEKTDGKQENENNGTNPS